MKSRNMVLIALLAIIGWGLKGEAKDMQHFKKPSREELKKKLTPEQFKVTQDEGTEKAFANAYWNNKEPGIYVDIVSGEPLFSSLDKFESGTGWPSFTRPLAKENIVERDDSKFFMKRTEVRSRHGDSHLGHVFEDGPPPTGLRYCLNSAALRFVPVSKLEEEGYGEFAKLFADRKPKREAIAIFAGGCFWCMEPPFEKMEGVSEVISGYIGGEKSDPTYEEVSSGKTGHVEAVKVVYDPDKVSYEQLLDVFWRNINPVDAGGQFVDRGKQYRSAIFYQNEAEAAAAKKSRDALAESGKFKEKIATEILPAGEFYEAENYHQDYYRKNPIRYKFYRMNSGRDEFIESHWKKKK